MEWSCSFTGHRPGRFCFGYDEESDACFALKRALAQQIENLAAFAGVTRFYTGMALGVDMWAAEAVLNLKASRPDVELTAVLPCETQANKWSPQQRTRYFDIIQHCDRATMLQRHYTDDCMMKRNRWLVDNTGYVLAVFDGGAKGGTKGGTAYTVRYAHEQGRKIITIHPDTLRVTTPIDTAAIERRRAFRAVPGDGKQEK